MVHVDLPGGFSAEMTAPDDVTGIQIEKAAGLLDLGDLDPNRLNAAEVGRMLMGMLPQMNRVLTVTLLESWTFVDGDDPRPVTMDTVGAFPLSVLRPLYAEAGKSKPALMEALGFAPAVIPDPKPPRG
jgi:hypothetical protein